MKLKPILSRILETKSEEEYAGTLRMLWHSTQTDKADSKLYQRIVDKRFGGKEPEELIALMNQASDMDSFIELAMNANSPSEITISAQNTEWKVAKIDSTHLKMMLADEGNWSRAGVYHIQQISNQPYYADLKAWLKGTGNPDGKKY
tara:strand:+ start:783 stop:1223 length:441 start_codon:yes stop_codon:yes gene_type:complete